MQSENQQKYIIFLPKKMWKKNKTIKLVLKKTNQNQKLNFFSSEPQT